jgi:L-amino acid N-acyltransferase YncA
MMARLIEVARARGFATMVGWILAENGGMLGMVAKLGFALAADPEDSHVRVATLPL